MAGGCFFFSLSELAADLCDLPHTSNGWHLALLLCLLVAAGELIAENNPFRWKNFLFQVDI
jgi:hypothetical protein